METRRSQGFHRCNYSCCNRMCTSTARASETLPICSRCVSAECVNHQIRVQVLGPDVMAGLLPGSYFIGSKLLRILVAANHDRAHNPTIGFSLGVLSATLT